MTQNINKIKIIVALGFTFLVLLLTIMFFNKSSIYTDNSYLKADIVYIKPKITGYVSQVYITDNQKVEANQIIAKIDDEDYKLKVLLAESNYNAVADKLNSLIAQRQIKDLEIEMAELRQNSAKVSFEMADKDFTRAAILVKDKAISQQDFDKKADIQNSLKNEHASAQSAYRSALLAKDVNEAEISQNTHLLSVANANLKLAKLDLEYTNVRAASSGTITRKSLQVGQLVTPQNTVAFLVQRPIWVIANFKETQIANIKEGQDAIITIDSFPSKKFTGKIDSLSPATGSEYSILPPENATGNFTKIVQRVPIKIIFNDYQDLSELKSGLSCEVKIEY